MRLILPHSGTIELDPGLPPGYKGPIISGANSFYSNSKIANFVSQELKGENYSIHFLTGLFRKPVITSGKILQTGLNSLFMIKNSARSKIEKKGKFHIRQDQYLSLYSKPSETATSFELQNEFRAINFFYSPEFLNELANYIPGLNAELISDSGLFTGKPNWVMPQMQELTRQLLNCPFREESQRLYFDLKVREMLLLILENEKYRNEHQVYFTPWETSKILKAKDLLEEHISSKPPNVKTLARLVGLNEFKLKMGFRYMFRSGIFEWILDQKMQYAKELILTTNKPIKDISLLVGYPLTTNFITAFRKKIGVTPASLRRK